MWTIANARLVRPGPNCSPKTRFSPGATGVWSSALALFVIAFQRRTESATFAGMLGAAYGCRAVKSRPHAALKPPETPRLEVVEVRLGVVLEVVESSVPVMEVSCAAGLWAIPSKKASTTASRSLVFNSLLIVQLRVIGRNCFRK